jgi:hypothetical protein
LNTQILIPTPSPATHSPPPSSLQHTHKRQRIRLNITNLEPLIRLFENLLPRTNRPLLRIKQRHHTHIRRGPERAHTVRQLSVLSWIILANVINEHNTRARLEGWDKRAQNRNAFRVGPVVQDPFQNVYVCGDGLWGEEVVGLEGDAMLEVGGEVAREDGGDLCEILYYDFEVGVGAGEGDVVVACGTAELEGGVCEYVVIF